MNTFIKSTVLVLLLFAGHISLRAQNFSYIQIIHNAADPALDTFDLYFKGGPSENNPYSYFDSSVVYHGATGQNPYPTDSEFTIYIYKKHSGGEDSNIIDSFYYKADTLDEDERCAFIISGVLDTTLFTANPNGRSIRLSIQLVRHLDSLALDTSHVLLDTAFVSARFFQGSTDLPAVNIKFRNGVPFTGSLKYGDTATDVQMPHGYYEFQVASPDTTQNFGTYSANFSGLGGEPLLIMCSGFVNIDSTDSTSAFGLYAVESGGGVITLPLEATGFQLLHNAADTALDSVDIYIDTVKTFSGFPFRKATPALVFKAYAKYNIGIARKNSTSFADTIWSKNFFFPRDTFFILTMEGLLSQTGYAANPDGISTAFNVLIKSPAEFQASSVQNFDFYMINGVTDAPPLNLVPQGGPYLLTDVEYADQTNYVSLPSEFYDLYVQDTTGTTLESAFANFLAFQSQSAVLLTSGFLNPDNNNNGPGMGLYMVPTTGGPFIPLFTPAGIGKVDGGTALSVFPNPASSQLHILFTLSQAENVSLQITDINGKLIQQVLNQANLIGTQNITVDLNGLADGLYFSRLITAEGASNSRFVIVR